MIIYIECYINNDIYTFLNYQIINTTNVTKLNGFSVKSFVLSTNSYKYCYEIDIYKYIKPDFSSKHFTIIHSHLEKIVNKLKRENKLKRILND